LNTIGRSLIQMERLGMLAFVAQLSTELYVLTNKEADRLEYFINNAAI